MASEDRETGASQPTELPVARDEPAGSSERTPLLDGQRQRKQDVEVNGADSSRRDERGDVNDNENDNDGNEDVNDDDGERTIIAAEVPTGRLVLILGAAYLGVFLGAIDSTIIATLSAPISSEFKSLSLLSWLATAYLISNAACQPLSGRLTDIFGRGPGLIFSNLFFAAGNLICGLARSEGVMILGRVVAGIGGGGLMSISTFLASDLVPLRKRGVVQGLGNVAYGAGSMLGGVFGGLFNDRTAWGWRLAFLVQVPPVLVSAGLVAALVRVPPKASDKSPLARIDFPGAGLVVSFLVLLLLGLNAGGNLVPWLHPLPLTTIPLALVALAAFLFWEARARQPVIPIRLLARRTVAAACFCNFFCTMIIMMALFYLPLWLQVRGRSATDAGIEILPSPVGISLCSVGAGYLMKRTGRYRLLGFCAVLVIVAACVVLSTSFDDHTPSWRPGLVFFMLGGGYGAMLTVTLLACIAAVDHSQQAVITSATYLARSCGATIGVTIGSAVYQNLLKARLWDRFGDLPGAAERIARIRDDLAELKHLPDSWRPGVIDSFMEAFRGVWLTMLGLSVLALICASLMRHHTLHSNLQRR